MADNLNHNSTYPINQEIISLQEHLNATQNEKYYRICKMFDDYSLAFKKHLSQDELECENYQLPIYGRFNREMFRNNKEALSVDSIRSSLSQPDTHIWDLIYFHEEFSEDNDSDEEEESSEDSESEEAKAKKEGKIVLKARHGLEYFIN